MKEQLKDGPNFDEALKHIEHAAMILQKLEAKQKSYDTTKVSRKLDNVYLKLIDIYLSLKQEA